MRIEQRIARIVVQTLALGATIVACALAPTNPPPPAAAISPGDDSGLMATASQQGDDATTDDSSTGSAGDDSSGGSSSGDDGGGQNSNTCPTSCSSDSDCQTCQPWPEGTICCGSGMCYAYRGSSCPVADAGRRE